MKWAQNTPWNGPGAGSSFKKAKASPRTTSRPLATAASTMPSSESTPKALMPSASSSPRNSPRPQPSSSTGPLSSNIGR
jgi:hypothetical protein